jgi:adenylate cyclase class IV
MRNLEIKANVESLAPLRSRLRRLDGAVRQPIVRQADWYLCVPKGRLKLRVFGADRGGQLIVYSRPDRRAPRTSDFQWMPVADAAGTLRLLTGMFGVRVCVRKRREVWLYKNARIHLDQVSGLGRFLEIEVIVSKGAMQARGLMKTLIAALGIQPDHLIAGSYSDMLARDSGLAPSPKSQVPTARRARPRRSRRPCPGRAGALP